MQNRTLFSHKKGKFTICDNIVDFKCIMLGGINQRKANTVWSHCYVESKITKLGKTENKWWAAELVGSGENGKWKSTNLQL